MQRPSALLVVLLIFALAPPGQAGPPAPERVRLVDSYDISPDGQTLVLCWRRDLWSVAAGGGTLRRLTAHAASDEQPQISPDGRRLAFVSDRSGSPQVYVMPLAGGVPERVTQHSEPYRLYDWFPDGKALLVRQRLDHDWRQADRFLRLSLDSSEPPRILFDDAGGSGALSPDGQRLAFVREGVAWWRKGYRGSAAGQVWIFDLASGEFRKVTQGDHGERWPLWAPDGKTLYIVSQQDGAFNLHAHDLATNRRRQLTHFKDDGMYWPAIDHAGRRIVFRRLFDLESMDLQAGTPSAQIPLEHAGDVTADTELSRTLQRASDVAFTEDGREIAICVGGDLYVMDTELREPLPVTNTAEEEREPVFAPDHDALYFVSDAGGRPDIWCARRSDSTRWWWQQSEFSVERVTNDEAAESDLRLTADGKGLTYIRKENELWLRPLPEGEPRQIIEALDGLDYAVSPDGAWVASAQSDADYNYDVWIRRTDGTGTPYNVSRHPDNDYGVTWSPDGRTLAFVGRRWGQESDIVFVRLRKQEDELSERDRKLEKAQEKMKGRKGPAPAEPAKPPQPGSPAPAPGPAPTAPDALAGTWRGSLQGEAPLPADGVDLTLVITRAQDGSYSGQMDVVGQFAGPLSQLTLSEERVSFSLQTPLGLLAGTGQLAGDRLEGEWEIPQVMRGTFAVLRDAPAPAPVPAAPKGADAPGQEATKKTPPAVQVEIDFEGLEERVQRISIPHSAESELFWSPDSKQLAFQATVEGQRGLYTVTFPDELQPKRVTTTTGSQARWIKEGNQILWLSAGVPTSLTPAGKSTAFGFQVRQRVDLGARHRAAFDQAWRLMRDHYYDERLGNRDWDAVRAKYRPMAEACREPYELELVVNLMLGELNGSHLGFRAADAPYRPGGWQEVTGHLGCRFVAGDPGPGLLIRDVIKGTPAYEERSRLRPGERVLELDGTALGPDQDIDALLTGDPQRDVELRVRGLDDKERVVRLRPTTYDAVRRRLYPHWVQGRRAHVEEASKGRLGYLHVQSMDWASFERFEEDLYKAGHNKEGLLIDVRDNGGGFTADHLLTAITQPRHAVTVGRRGEPGYPQDRQVYASWWRPIAVLCNQDSFSNAEIFAHAVKTLKRGPVIGVPTAGGVISTGSAQVMDVGTLRMPGRGWFVLPTGQDMELAGCVPDHILWPLPGEMSQGIDRQLDKAIQVLLEQVDREAAAPDVPLVRAAEREQR